MRRALTPRAIIFGAVVLLALMALLYPTRELFAVDGDIAELRGENEALTSRIDELRERRSELADPLTLEREARRQLYQVPEGSRLYVVLEPDEAEQERVLQESSEQRTGTGAWYERLAESLRWADQQQ